MEIEVKYNVSKFRYAKNLTLRELAEMSGVSKSEIHKIENNNAQPSFPTMCRLAIALGVELEQLYTCKRL